ncbi:hypothetical protein Pyn_02273 [Prunus yedoensis var. nudiflora]|uniref:Uncharacterized protein n=1 Tax=Prunus yedoensis var. nudiflora TaxID=2094558 RepID=A0A314YIB3_PRUYE|nr:hypothetical protein Pyn_02273 [Prunus yedoensis var. nudiflora]
MLEQEDGGLYGFSDDERNRQISVPVTVNEPAKETTVPSDLSQATGSMLPVSDPPQASDSMLPAPNPSQVSDSMLPVPPAMSQAYASSQSTAVLPGTDNTANPMNGVIKSRVLRMWDPESVGTHYRNGSLRLAIGGLSLNQNWCDPDTIPPWALNRGACVALLDTQGEPNFQAHIDPSPLVNKPCIEVVGDLEETGPLEDDQVIRKL